METLVEDKQLARPLPVLVQLIRNDFEEAKRAAERAAMRHYVAAGQKLTEAQSQMKFGEFRVWIKRHFKISRRQAGRYMGLAKEAGPGGHIFHHRGLQAPQSRRKGGARLAQAGQRDSGRG
jgi:hypothetical protein